jgi:hypothetical protein
MKKHNFREVEFSRDVLFLFLCDRRGLGGSEADDSDWIAKVAGVGKNVKSHETELHVCCRKYRKMRWSSKLWILSRKMRTLGVGEFQKWVAYQISSWKRDTLVVRETRRREKTKTLENNIYIF